MKIEFGFQANCSELVTHLGFTTGEDIAAGMKKVAELTGWTWKVKPTEDHELAIPSGKIDAHLVKVDDDDGIFGIDSDALIAALGDEIPADLSGALKDSEKLLTPGLYSPAGEKLVFEYACWCGEDQFHLSIDGIDIPDMPMFHKIRSLFDSDFMPHDGGDMFPYMAWFSFHYNNKDMAVKILEEFSSGDPEEDLEDIRNNPPLPGSKPPSRKDMNMLRSFLGEDEDDGEDADDDDDEKNGKGDVSRRHPGPQPTAKPPQKKGFFGRLFSR